MRVLQAIRNSAGALCLALTPLSAALAVPPEVIGPFHDEGQAAVADCGSFQVLDRYVADYYLRLFYDKQGQLVKMIEQVEGTDTFVNSVLARSIRPSSTIWSSSTPLSG